MNVHVFAVLQPQTAASFYVRLWHQSRRLISLGISSYELIKTASVQHELKLSRNVSSDTSAFDGGFTTEVLPSTMLSGAAVLLEPAQCFAVDQRTQPEVSPKYGAASAVIRALYCSM